MNTVGGRIKFRRRQLKLTQKDIAEYVGISASAVTQWESDATGLSSESLLKLSSLLECSPEWLLSGKGELEPSIRAMASKSKVVPVISWVQAGAWTEALSAAGSRSEWVETTAKISNLAFALRVKGDSMTSSGSLSIPEGSIVIVDPEYGFIEDVNEKIVIAQTNGNHEATIKKFVIDGPNKYLMPLNPQFKPIEVDDTCKLIGVVKQIIIDLQ
ncbi:helix-turn-helix domain-containing protein [Yersinia mollaretii]|uniref:Helix-turn-helix domain-containing protein n=1 Tax=Yersinia mollaretii TaxID=33060 RepID=A0AA44CKX5_YERMO|nr:S24 family peptidase [Yersinia mollaretii]NIL22732.1 helix-turn-helix domain-containing protein [Yersinia mollaretii]CNI38354.1 repressor protein C2 [Yersinia mollaretii]